MSSAPEAIGHLGQDQDSIYNVLKSTVGVESAISARYISETEEIVTQNNERDYLTLEAFHILQDNIHAKFTSHAISLDAYKLELRELSHRMSASRQFDHASRTLEEYGFLARIDAYVSADDVATINTRLQAITPLKVEHETAPFAAYGSNTADAWQYVPADTTKQFLLAKPFVNSSDIQSLKKYIRSTTTINSTTSYGEEKKYFEIPTDVVVNAAGFESWLGRNGRYSELGAGEKTIAIAEFYSNVSYRDISINTIKAYASKPSELPAVGYMEVLVQPNGLGVATNVSGDSHRIGAAILRGERTIKANSLGVVLLEDNVIDPLVA